MGRICGSSRVQRSVAAGQRVRKRQPEGTSSGDGVSPRGICGWALRRLGVSDGTDASSVAV